MQGPVRDGCQCARPARALTCLPAALRAERLNCRRAKPLASGGRATRRRLITACRTSWRRSPSSSKSWPRRVRSRHTSSWAEAPRASGSRRTHCRRCTPAHARPLPSPLCRRACAGVQRQNRRRDADGRHAGLGGGPGAAAVCRSAAAAVSDVVRPARFFRGECPLVFLPLPALIARLARPQHCPVRLLAIACSCPSDPVRVPLMALLATLTRPACPRRPLSWHLCECSPRAR